ncbi:MAG: hypothetical protein M1540_02665 [Candidatus Bathyarchaeota archaeon]|nr:hypothetical protein [Candidatus Bathyarchaeota archaeon]
MADDVADRLPEDLRASYSDARKGSEVIESLKVAAALKLWVDRGYREMGFEVSSDLGGKTFYIDVLAKDDERMVGVECDSGVDLGRLRRRVALLRRSLPEGSYLVVVFPFGVEERHVDEAVELADEVWVTGKDGKVERMMCTSVFHKG